MGTGRFTALLDPWLNLKNSLGRTETRVALVVPKFLLTGTPALLSTIPLPVGVSLAVFVYIYEIKR